MVKPSFISKLKKDWLLAWLMLARSAKEIVIYKHKLEMEMKEYLMPNRNYEYILTDAREALEPHAKDWISIPKWANYAYKNDAGICFLKGELGFNHPLLVWVRPTQPEALPFIDDNPH